MKRFSLILVLVLTNFCFGHKYYVSIADLEYDGIKQRIKGALKLTAHDFEHVLENKFNRTIELENVTDDSEVGQYMQVYLANHFKLFSEGTQATPFYLGKEITPTQDLYLYFTFTNVSNPRSIKVTNTLLFDHFSAQQNIVHYTYKEQTKSVTLVRSKKTNTIHFD